MEEYNDIMAAALHLIQDDEFHRLPPEFTEVNAGNVAGKRTNAVKHALRNIGDWLRSLVAPIGIADTGCKWSPDCNRRDDFQTKKKRGTERSRDAIEKTDKEAEKRKKAQQGQGSSKMPIPFGPRGQNPCSGMPVCGGIRSGSCANIEHRVSSPAM